MEEKSELLMLFDKKHNVGLDDEEFDKAKTLILNPVCSDNVCPLCQMASVGGERSIFDLGLCKSHALHALMN